MVIAVGIAALIFGGLMGYEIGSAKGFTDGYEVGRKYNKW